MGVVREINELVGGGFQYKVFLRADDQRYVAEDDLLPLVETLLDEETFEHHRHLDDLRREVLLAKLRTPYGENLFSLRASRVEFHPYQFKPVLKLLHQPDHRLLIADEFGLGKTIEAGIILTELQARIDLQRVLVICPASLRIKWRDEMRLRFEEEFEILDAGRLREFLDEYLRIGLVARKKAIVSLELIRRTEFAERLANDRTHFDLVVIDEAHHIRNRTTRAHDLASIVSDNADSLLLLTATPLHLGRPDLFNLLHIVSPGQFDDFDTFEDQVEPNRFINRASRFLQMNRPSDALSAVKEVERTKQRERYVRDPYYQEITEILTRKNLSREDAVRVQRALLEINSLTHVFTRSKKREVMANAPLREAKLIRYSFEPEEQAFYDATVKFVRRHWKETQENPWAVGFALVMRERQAASCLPAFRDHYATAMTEIYSSPEDESMVEGLMTDDTENEVMSKFPKSIREAASELDAAANRVGDIDTKFDKFLTVLKMVLEDDPDSKVLIFSFFKKTLEYLLKRLVEEGIETALIYGDIDVFDRPAIVERFQNKRELRVLLSSEVGSEGLDFQFCKVMFNYDLPWNPMKVEQRIGRIDRFGQKSPKVSIYNFIASGTIEDRIYNRLFSRIRIFEESIGDLEEILGDVLRELTQKIYTKELTPEQEEKLADQAANAVLNRKQEMDEFERSKNEFLGQDAIFFDDVREAEATGKYVSPDEIRALVMSYLDSQFPRSQLQRNEGDNSWHMVPDSEFVQAMRNFILRVGRSDYSQHRFLERLRPGKLLPITFIDDIAYERKLVEFLTIKHPITRIAKDYWIDRAAADPPVLVINVKGDQGDSRHFFFVFLLRTRAIRLEERLIPVLVSADDLTVDEFAGERFFRLVQSDEEFRPGVVDELDEDKYMKANEIAVRHMGGLRARIEDETRKLNDARVNSRRFAVEQTFDAKIRRVEETLAKVREQRVRRMKISQLENLRAARTASIQEIESRRDVDVSYTLEISGLMTIQS